MDTEGAEHPRVGVVWLLDAGAVVKDWSWKNIERESWKNIERESWKNIERESWKWKMDVESAPKKVESER